MEQALREFKAGADPKRLKKAEADLAKARTRDSMFAYEKLTHLVDGEPRIISDPPLIVPIVELPSPGKAPQPDRERDPRPVPRYRARWTATCAPLLDQFRYVDLARKAVGVGSVGTRDWIVLFLGVDSQDPLFPPNQGGAAVGARAVRGQERVPESRPAGRRRAAVNAGRHVTSSSAGGASGPRSTGRNGTSTCAN
jgi:Uncharacterized protein conserved in bacteria (DUF2252).